MISVRIVFMGEFTRVVEGGRWCLSPCHFRHSHCILVTWIFVWLKQSSRFLSINYISGRFFPFPKGLVLCEWKERPAPFDLPEV